MRFPQFRFDDDMLIVYQGDTGILSASRCVLAYIQVAQQHGAVVMPNTPVQTIRAHPNSVEIVTEDSTFTAAKLVITAGSWAASMLAQLGLNLPLKPTRCQEIYFDTVDPAQYQSDHFPAFIAHMKYQYDRMPYGIGSHNGSGLKVAFHGGQRVNHPSEINYIPDQEEVERALQFGRRYLPGITGMRSTRICLYTMTPDEHFLLDLHPEYSHIAFAGGCSGHAFKFGNLIGKILTELLLQGKTQHDISLFGVNRFL
jgi:monomeric sarcosine oxidase